MTKPIRLEHFKACMDWWDKRKENEVAWKVGIDAIKGRNYNLDIKNPHTVEEEHGDPAELLEKLEDSEGQTAQLRDRLRSILEEALAMSPERLLRYFEHVGSSRCHPPARLPLTWPFAASSSWDRMRTGGVPGGLGSTQSTKSAPPPSMMKLDLFGAWGSGAISASGSTPNKAAMRSGCLFPSP